MLEIKVLLHSAVTREATELASMVVVNDGSGDNDVGNYYGEAYKKGKSYKDDDALVIKRGNVLAYRRRGKHVWNLVAQMLQSMGYK